MPQKKPRFIVTFHTTAEAMATEKVCRQNRLGGRLIPAPRILSADCGIAWSAPPELREATEQAIRQAGIEVAGFHEMALP